MYATSNRKPRIQGILINFAIHVNCNQCQETCYDAKLSSSLGVMQRCMPMQDKVHTC